MKLLAVETATEACSVALWNEGEILLRSSREPRAHARRVLGQAEAVLAEAGLALATLDAIAFGRGPGAFTGLRIAAGVTQGLALGADLPVVPVSSLAALASAAGRQHSVSRVLTLLDARMGEVYWSAFRVARSAVEPLGEERVDGPEAVQLPDDRPGWFAAGPGWAAHTGVFATRLGEQVTGSDAELLPQADDVARLAVRLFNEGVALDPGQALPVYLRDRVAQRTRAPGGT